jgi:hypothetical protein
VPCCFINKRAQDVLLKGSSMIVSQGACQTTGGPGWRRDELRRSAIGRGTQQPRRRRPGRGRDDIG